MDVEFHPAKDIANVAKHGVFLAFGIRIWNDVDVLIVPTIRAGDEEERFKAIGRVDGDVWTAVHVYRGDRGRFISGRRSMQVSKEHMIAIPAEAADAEDRPVSVAALERAQVGRRLRQLRATLGLSQVAFAGRYGIPVANIRQYEIGRSMPPPAVQAFLKVIAAEPERAAAAVAG